MNKPACQALYLDALHGFERRKTDLKSLAFCPWLRRQRFNWRRWPGTSHEYKSWKIQSFGRAGNIRQSSEIDRMWLYKNPVLFNFEACFQKKDYKKHFHGFERRMTDLKSFAFVLTTTSKIQLEMMTLYFSRIQIVKNIVLWKSWRNPSVLREW